MCLVVDREIFRPSTTRKDEVYYKVARTYATDYYGDELFQSPFYNMVIIPGQLYSIKDDKKWDIYRNILNPCEFMVNGGCYHLYEKREDAERLAAGHYGWVVLKAVVPKGTKYVKGYTQCGRMGSIPSLAVRKVRFEKL